MIIPKKHKVWVVMKDENEQVYKITADEKDRSVYYLFKQLSENDYQQVATSSDPTKLEKKVFKNYPEDMVD